MDENPSKEPARMGRATVAAVWLAAAAGAILVLLVAAGSAEGGTYRAAQCNPAFDAGRGDFLLERNSDHYVGEADCDAGGLIVRHRAQSTRRDRWGAWTLPAPAGLLFTGIRAKVTGTAADGHVPGLFTGMPGAGAAPLGRAAGNPHVVGWRGAGVKGLHAALRCTSGRCGEGSRARVMVRRVALRVLDEAEPAVTLAGPLASGLTRRGIATLQAVASDEGSGVRRIFLEVNGKPVGARRVPCELRRQVATRLRPCPATTEKVYELDTTGKAFHQGLNRLRVCVDDLAFSGESNRACARHKARVDNECPVDEASEPGTIHARLEGAARRRAIPADRSAALTGTLTATDGSPIVGARVCVATRVARGDAIEQVIATPRTEAGGRFSVRLDPGPTRDVRVAHWSDAGTVAEHYLRLRVRARPSLRVSPARTLRNGEEARFIVRLHGPDAGSRQVQLEVRSDRRWVLVRSHRASPRGIWRDSYRFGSTTGTRTYRFRAVVPRQRGYPYERGASNVRRVRVRGS